MGADSGRIRIRLRFIVVDENADCGAVKVVILAGTQRPEEKGQSAQPEQQRTRDEDGETVHRAARRRRSALATTIIEDPDMASAAINGVTTPATASGTAMTL